MIGRTIDNSIEVSNCGDYVSILAFNGPYGFKDSAKFITFEMVSKVVEEEKPSLVMLNGPFYSTRSECCETGNYPVMVNGVQENKIFDVQLSRRKQINDLITRIQSVSPHTQVQVLPDIDEFDCFYPLPLPRNAIDNDIFDGNNQKVNSCSPCLIKIGEGRKIRIGYIGNHALIDIMKNAKVLGESNNRVEASLRELINQHCMYPTPGAERQFDITKIGEMCYQSEDAPDVLFISSIVNSFVRSYNSTVAVTFKKSTMNSESCSIYSRVLIDSRAMLMSTEVRICLIIFEEKYRKFGQS